MSDRILVTGATGLQGGAVARHLLKLGKPEVRCLTRRPDSEASKTFKQLGADVVKADFDDPASLKPVLKGCTGVFGVTNFWEAFLREYEQGANLIDAASEAGVAHLVLSTLPLTCLIGSPLDGGNRSCFSFSRDKRACVQRMCNSRLVNKPGGEPASAERYCTKLKCVRKQLIINEILVEATGVELFSVLITRNLLILGIATTAKKAPLPDPLYVYCTKILSL